jgi:eukaryotic-like serine/threonine-protein kinase
MADRYPTRTDVSPPGGVPGPRPSPTEPAPSLDSLRTRATSSDPDTQGTGEDDAGVGFSLDSSIIDREIPPDAFPGYLLLELLGEGGMGAVYKARQEGLNRLVALKVILGGRRAGPRTLIRFLAEAEAIASIKHPNVVEVYEYDEADGRPFLAMECLTGGSLADRLKSAGKLEPGAAAELMIKLARGVQAAHDQGIVHRDLKPGNVLFNALDDPKITDFGLAKRAVGSDLTRTQAVMGTPAYMSPEQAQGRAKFVGPAADIYALGVILYECLTGVRPFDETDPFVLLSRVVDEEPGSPRHHVPGLPRDLELIALKCLRKDPADRYPGAEELAEDLRRFLAGEPILARPSSVARKAWLWSRRYPLPASLAGALLASALVGSVAVCLAWLQADSERKEKTIIAEYLANSVLAESSSEVNPLGAEVGKSYLSLGEYGEAGEHLRKAMALDIELRGAGDPAALRVANLLGIVLEQSGRPGPAEALLRDNLATSRRWLGPDDPITLEASSRLGALLREAGKLDQAEPLIRSTLLARRRVLKPDHPGTLRTVHDLCLLEVARRRIDAAAALADEYERGIRCARGPKHPDNVTALANLGLIQLLRGRPDQAEPFYRRAADEARRILGEDHPTTRAAIAEHARVARDAGLPTSSPPVRSEISR